MPSGGNASTSSPLARSTAASVPIRDRWTAWTAVTTPIAGFAIAARSAISPPTYMPISSTAASCSGPNRRTVSGSPISLFWLPSLLSVRRAVPRTAAIASLVDVLAMLPVTPTTTGSKRRRQPAATAPRAAAPSGTRTTVTSPSESGSASGRVTSTAAAPRRTASPRWAWPSVRSPGRATKSWPGDTRRESTAAPWMGRSDRVRSRPPVHPTRSSAVRVGCPPVSGGGVDGSTSVTDASVACPVLTGRMRRPSSAGGRRTGPASPSHSSRCAGTARTTSPASPAGRPVPPSACPPRCGLR